MKKVLSILFILFFCTYGMNRNEKDPSKNYPHHYNLQLLKQVHHLFPHLNHEQKVQTMDDRYGALNKLLINNFIYLTNTRDILQPLIIPNKLYQQLIETNNLHHFELTLYSLASQRHGFKTNHTKLHKIYILNENIRNTLGNTFTILMLHAYQKHWNVVLHILSQYGNSLQVTKDQIDFIKEYI